MSGRGAWPKSGSGGTLNAKGDGPGMYYVLATGDTPQVGSAGWDSPDVNERAVHGAVLAIQNNLNTRLRAGLKVDGVFGTKTANAVRDWQTKKSLTVDGIFGAQTAKSLFLVLLKATVISNLMATVCGLVQNESAWDPGAVGFVDEDDLGLAQMNGPATGISEQDRLAAKTALDYAENRLQDAISFFNGDTRTAIASYNLGRGGASSWKRAGSPDFWTPEGSIKPREVNAYINRILTSCQGV